MILCFAPQRFSGVLKDKDAFFEKIAGIDHWLGGNFLQMIVIFIMLFFYMTAVRMLKKQEAAGY